MAGGRAAAADGDVADEVERLLAALESPKFRVFFTTVYATGLRLGEACRLETRDIDAARGVIHVRQGKGGKDRLVMLSARLCAILRAYWAHERPPAPWLFASRTKGRPLNADVARKAIKRAAARAGLEKKSRRMCCATASRPTCSREGPTCG